MQQHSDHVSVASNYHPPQTVAKALIHQALRNIPGSQSVVNKIDGDQTQGYDRLRGLRDHEYNNTGRLQFAYQN